MIVEGIVRAAEMPWGSAEDLCVASSVPDHLALTETFRLCRGYASDAAADLGFAQLESALHAPTKSAKAFLLANASVSGGNHVITSRGHLIRESLSPLNGGTRVANTIALSTPRKLDDSITWIVCGSDHPLQNYWSWLAQALPALVQSLVFARDQKIDRIGLVTPQLSGWQLRSLALLGLAGCPRIEVGHQDSCSMESAIYSELQSSLSWSRAVRASFFRKGIREALLGSVYSATDIHPRVYASRSDASSRRMLNETELEQRLSARGFRIVRCSEHTVDEQVALFANAEIVVGPHGANLTNALFARPTAAVYELQCTSYVNASLAALSRIAGSSHWVDQFGPRDGAIGGEWHCDIDAVLRTIDIIERRAAWDHIYRAGCDAVDPFARVGSA